MVWTRSYWIVFVLLLMTRTCWKGMKQTSSSAMLQLSRHYLSRVRSCRSCGLSPMGLTVQLSRVTMVMRQCSQSPHMSRILGWSTCCTLRKLRRLALLGWLGLLGAWKRALTLMALRKLKQKQMTFELRMPSPMTWSLMKFLTSSMMPTAKLGFISKNIGTTAGETSFLRFMPILRATLSLSSTLTIRPTIPSIPTNWQYMFSMYIRQLFLFLRKRMWTRPMSPRMSAITSLSSMLVACMKIVVQSRSISPSAIQRSNYPSERLALTGMRMRAVSSYGSFYRSEKQLMVRCSNLKIGRTQSQVRWRRKEQEGRASCKSS